MKTLTEYNATCLRIAVCVPVRGTFLYVVPQALAPCANVGCQVIVPFKNRKVEGYILEKVSQAQANYADHQTLSKPEILRY